MIRTSYLLACLLLLAGCLKSNPAGHDAAVTLDARTARPFEIVPLELPGGALTSTTYEAKLDKQKVVLHRQGARALLLLVPDLAPGTYALTFKADGTSYTGRLTVVPGEEVAEPQAYFSSVVARLDESPVLGRTSAMAQVIQRFEALAPADQRVAAQVIANNDVVHEQLRLELEAYLKLEAAARGGALPGGAGKGADCNARCLIAQFAKITLAGAALAAASPALGVGLAIGAVIGLEVGLSFIANRASILVDAVKRVAKEVFDLVYWPSVKAYELHQEKVNNTVELWFTGEGTGDAAGKHGAGNAPPAFVAGRTYRLTVADVPYRSLRAKDASHPDAVIRNLVASYEALRALARERFGATLPDFGTKEERRPLQRLDRVRLTVTDAFVEINALAVRSDHLEVTFDYKGTAGEQEKLFDLQVAFQEDGFSFAAQREAKLLPKSNALLGWYAGKYTLQQGHWGNACSPEAGKSGDYYVYVYRGARSTDSLRNIVVIPSILPDLPNLYIKNPVERVVQGIHRGFFTNPSWRELHPTLSDRRRLDFGWLEFHAGGISETNWSYGGQATRYFAGPYQNRNCAAGDFNYKLLVSGAHVGSDRPGAVSQEHIDLLIAHPASRHTIVVP